MMRVRHRKFIVPRDKLLYVHKRACRPGCQSLSIGTLYAGCQLGLLVLAERLTRQQQCLLTHETPRNNMASVSHHSKISHCAIFNFPPTTSLINPATDIFGYTARLGDVSTVLWISRSSLPRSSRNYTAKPRLSPIIATVFLLVT